MDKVGEKLRHLERVIGGWSKRGVDELERDAVLKTLQDVYSAVKSVPIKEAGPDIDAYVNDDVKKGPSRSSLVRSLYGGKDDVNAYVNDDVNDDEDDDVKPVLSRRTLHQYMALNDRLMMILTMFGGDKDAFDAAMDRLDGFEDLDSAIIYIHETWQWAGDNEGVRRLVEILEQKLEQKNG